MTVVGPREARPAAPLLALRFEEDVLWAIDQTELPWREREIALRSAEEVAGAIRRLAIRGAPLIGVAAAYGVALELAHDRSPEALARACHQLLGARPTAVNLAHAVERVRRAVLGAQGGEASLAALAEARAIEEEEREASAAMGRHGAELLAGARRILTHCNTGALAAPGRGTALSVIAELAQGGHLEEVLATESRPLLQGARLTTYELSRWGIPSSLIVDAAAPGLIASGAVEAVVVGCDRVAANGDVANKVGTYGLALAAQAAGIPFVVVGPTSTIDFDCPSGDRIPIEQRDGGEVRSAGGVPIAGPEVVARNPAFDLTPAALIYAIVTERGVARPVSAATLGALAGG